MTISLNTLKPAKGARRKPKCLGRGTGCGLGKTSGFGMKGQKGRRGSRLNPTPSGGQTPLIRRFPKFGFTSHQAPFNSELRLGEISALEESPITIDVLKKLGLVGNLTRAVKIIFDQSSCTKPLQLSGIRVTEKVKKVIEAAGGKIE